MKIAILSDIHDQVWHLQAVLDWLKEHSVDALIFCGDFCSPFVLAQIQNGFSGPVHAVFGNNDGDTFRMTRLAAGHVHLHGELAELAIVHGQLYSKSMFKQNYPEHDFYDEAFTGKRIAVNHFPEIARGLFESGLYELVCFGHNHTLSKNDTDGRLLVNPGSIMGYRPGSKQAVAPGFMVYDSEEHQAEAWQISFYFTGKTYESEIELQVIGA